MYLEIKSWQQGIAALLGFFALMAAALFNYHLNRRRDSRLRSDEALSIALGLYCEILLLQRELARVAAHLSRQIARGKREVDKHFLESHKLPEPVPYNALAPKIGLLPPHIATAVAEFHQNLEAVRSWLPLVVEDCDRPFTYSFLAVLKPARDGVRNITTALNEIASMAALTTTPTAPELGETDIVIEMEELSFETG